MGDPKEARAEASPPRAAARGGLSLLSQAESEEPSAQVSPRRGATPGTVGFAGPPCLGGRSPGSFWSFLPRLLDSASRESPGVRLPGTQCKTHLASHLGVIDGL